MSDSESDSNLGEVRTGSMHRTDSKLRNSIDAYGTNSYYYAHNRDFNVPEDAKVVQGPGIITGGAPVKLSEVDPSDASHKSEVRRKVEKYSWCDDGDKVRIYIDDPNVIALICDSDEAVSCKFESTSLTFSVRQSPSVCFAIDIATLTEEILPEHSSSKVSLGKRVTLTLKKKDADRKWHSLKKN